MISKTNQCLLKIYKYCCLTLYCCQKSKDQLPPENTLKLNLCVWLAGANRFFNFKRKRKRTNKLNNWMHLDAISGSLPANLQMCTNTAIILQYPVQIYRKILRTPLSHVHAICHFDGIMQRAQLEMLSNQTVIVSSLVTPSSHNTFPILSTQLGPNTRSNIRQNRFSYLIRS